MEAYTGFPSGAPLEAFYNLCRVAGCEKLILYRGLNDMPTSPEPPAGADGAAADTDSALADTAASSCTTPTAPQAPARSNASIYNSRGSGEESEAFSSSTKTAEGARSIWKEWLGPYSVHAPHWQHKRTGSIAICRLGDYCYSELHLVEFLP